MEKMNPDHETDCWVSLPVIQTETTTEKIAFIHSSCFWSNQLFQEVERDIHKLSQRKILYRAAGLIGNTR